MSFQPLGYRFEIDSPLPPSKAKEAIRSRTKYWFDVKGGARGWIVGPFICLWFSAFDQYGPMLFGVISDKGFGTRVQGRAGSDLNGVLMFSLLVPLTAFSVYKMVREGSATGGALAMIALVFLVGGPLIYWLAHTARRDAAPLVRFVGNAITPTGQSLRSKSGAVSVAEGLTLIVDGEDFGAPVTAGAIYDSLIDVGAQGTAILARAPEIYIQCRSETGAYVLERRDGDRFQHFRAAGSGSRPIASGPSGPLLGFEEVLGAFLAFASASPLPSSLIWERTDVSS